MTSASDEKWRTFNCFFQPGRAKDLSAPLYKRNVEARSCNQCCLDKTIIVKYYNCVSVFLPYLSSMQCACSLLYCHVWPVCRFQIYLHYLINGTIFGKFFFNVKLILIFLQIFLQYFSF